MSVGGITTPTNLRVFYFKWLFTYSTCFLKSHCKIGNQSFITTRTLPLFKTAVLLQYNKIDLLMFKLWILPVCRLRCALDLSLIHIQMCIRDSTAIVDSSSLPFSHFLARSPPLSLSLPVSFTVVLSQCHCLSTFAAADALTISLW